MLRDKMVEEEDGVVDRWTGRQTSKCTDQTTDKLLLEIIISSIRKFICNISYRLDRMLFQLFCFVCMVSLLCYR